jgi:predicted ATPase
MFLDQDCVVITGGPSVGKTTLVRALRRKGYAVLREVGTTVIRHGTYRPDKDRDLFQKIILQRQLKVEARRRKGRLLLCDRGLLDGVAYYLNDGLPVPDEFAKLDTSHYRGCLLLEPLGVFEKTAIRPDFENLQYAEQITPRFEQCYGERGISVPRVPAMPIEDRVSFVERQIAQWYQW